jgi:hypothetical protein
MKLILTLSLVASLAVATLGYAQQAQPRTSREDALDPSPIDPKVDPNIEMFVNDWKNAAPRSAYGGLIFQDILTRLEGPDPLHPTRKGAVLVNITAISHAQLAPGARANGRAPAGERQVFFTMGGSGTIAVNSKSHELRKGAGFTLTPDTEFALSNTGKGPMSFYVRTEPLPANYIASADLVVVNSLDNDRRVGAYWAHSSASPRARCHNRTAIPPRSAGSWLKAKPCSRSERKSGA